MSQWNHASYKAFCSNYGDYKTRAVGKRCWNKEAITAMRTDMQPVWDKFTVDVVETQLADLSATIAQVFAAILTIASPPDAELHFRSSMRTLTTVTVHRRGLVVSGIEQALETLHSALSSLSTNAFSRLRTAYIGKLMEETYHAAAMEYGMSSHIHPQRF
jgi:hypothetical protein